MRLLKKQKDVLLGVILGDGYLQKTGKKNSRLRLEHGLKQKNYLLWKVDILKPLFNGSPKELQRIHPLTKKTYFYIRHQSNSSSLLGKLRSKFYENGIKIIPLDLSKILTSSITLAVWFMDDGYYYRRDKCGYLYLGNISLKEAEVISTVLFTNFGLKNKVLKKKKGYAIYFSPPQMIMLKNLIKPYLLEDFNYKIPS